ncbi:3',5'-cyclic-AMP phosphodiesterase [uncultured Acinetobacter sp.]|uniref:3',5'-cyclic-AMP phosphodiesterase n=1 Tax=uncultured Acinetobacter sp. TaxID=165433 RepID=UPI002583A1AA|nr:3',5'-cyclic-AMP phosphodiesterase [uncultured Acinetobacter sp.]
MTMFQVAPFSSQAHVIIQITDTHLLEDPQHEFVGINPEQSFHQVIAHIRAHYPKIDAIIHTGDLAQTPTAVTYARYLDYMQTLGIPFFHVPGNHDDPAHFPFHASSSQDISIVAMGQWHLVLLNSAVVGKVDGWISDHQLMQLQQHLQQHSSVSTILACHHHPFEMQSKWIDQHKLKNTATLLDVIHAHPQVKAVLCGHVHQESSHRWEHVEFLSSPSTSVQFKPRSDDFAFDALPSGYRVLKLQANGEFESHIHRIEKMLQNINTEISGY